MENHKQQSYRQIIKATSLFGGAQVFNIIINIVRSKMLAVILGPFGMGLSGLLTSTISMVDGLTNFALGTSAVKSISIANEKNEHSDVSRIICILNRLVWFTGIFGALLTIFFSSKLSLLSFGNTSYKFTFIWLSVTVLFMQLTNVQHVMLQGMRKLQILAKANILGSFAGLVISIPFYYYYKLDGITPAIIITSFTILLISRFYAQKYKPDYVKVNLEENVKIGKSLLSLGIVLSLSNITTLGSSYIMRIYIGKLGGLSDLGLYSAGFAIIGTYVGLIFSAMGTDYFPRLSALSNSTKNSNQLINHQSEISLLILAPMLCFFFIFINKLIIVLYSIEFININSMIRFAALGMFFKAVSWSLGYILLTKGTPRNFFVNELVSGLYMLFLNIFGYKIMGLEGLGVSFLIGYILHFIQIYLFAKFKYGFAFESAFYKIFLIQFLLGTSCFILVRVMNGFITYFIGVIFICMSISYSIWQLDKRIGILQICKSIKNRMKR